ncbi:MAG: hypothetical protein OHK0039_04270 [Bacteroidia bacterium]
MDPLTINPAPAEATWDVLLALADAVAQAGQVPGYVVLRLQDRASVCLDRWPQLLPEEQRVLVHLGGPIPEVPRSTAVVAPDRLFSLRVVRPGDLSDAQLDLVRLYLPYCLLPIEARRLQRAVAVSHFAQSLDGKIATLSGDSKWIGNDDNLLHAHRMRALCPGILIGTRTLQNDKPSLTVRHVPGENPRRIVISSSARDFSSLFASCPEPVLVLGTAEEIRGENLEYERLTTLNGHIPCVEILRSLYRRGIYSVYIEGGAETTSLFLQDRALDVVQLHISPQLFGSGISGIRLPQIERVQEAVRFRAFAFHPMGDTYMFVGEPAPPDA